MAVASPAFAGNLIAASFAVAARRMRRGPARPSWSYRFEVVATALKARAASIAKLEWLAQRRAWASMTAPAPILRQVVREKTEVAGLYAEWFTPKEGATFPGVVLYIHGGSFIYGSIESHRDVIARIALACSARVCAVEYRLAPEHPFPAAFDDSLAAYRALAAEHRVVVAGDSAGANLAAAIALVERPLACVLLSPWIDLTASGGSLENNQPFDYATEAIFQSWTDCYLAGADPRDPRASPSFGDLSKLPRTLVVLGGAEMLHDQAHAFVRASGAELYEAPDQIHNFPMFAGMFPECGEAYTKIGAFVRASATLTRV